LENVLTKYDPVLLTFDVIKRTARGRPHKRKAGVDLVSVIMRPCFARQIEDLPPKSSARSPFQPVGFGRRI